MTQNMIGQLPNDELYPVCYVVADDDSEELMLMRMALDNQQKPLPVRLFEDGQQVIDYLEENTAIRSDKDSHWLLVLDMYMPRLNGLETVRAIRQNPDWNTIPILLFIDGQNEELVRQAINSGANGCVSKPERVSGYSQLFDQFFSPYLKNSQSA